MKDKIVAALLALFLGGIGIHRFYLGESGRGILYLLFCWTFIPSVIALIDFVCFLAMSKENFDAKYNKQPQPVVNVHMNAPVHSSPSSSKADELAKLHALKVQGALTDQEYEREKAKVMA